MTGCRFNLILFLSNRKLLVVWLKFLSFDSDFLQELINKFQCCSLNSKTNIPFFIYSRIYTIKQANELNFINYPSALFASQTFPVISP